MIGTSPAFSKGCNSSRTISFVSSTIGWAAPYSSSVTISRRESTCLALTPRDFRTSASKREESCSPYATMASLSICSGSERRDTRISRSDSSPRANSNSPLKAFGLSDGIKCFETSTCRSKCGSSDPNASAKSPFFAVSNAASKASVTFVIAETTRTGCFSICDETM